MNSHLLIRFSLVLLLAIPTISETCYKMHFKFQHPKDDPGNLSYSDVTANCTLGKRLARNTSETPKEYYAKKESVDTEHFTSFTMKANGGMKSVNVNETDLKPRGIAVEEAVVECKFLGRNKVDTESTFGLRVFDIERNPRFGEDVSEAWTESTWVLKPKGLRFKAWYVQKGKAAEGVVYEDDEEEKAEVEKWEKARDKRLDGEYGGMDGGYVSSWKLENPSSSAEASSSQERRSDVEKPKLYYVVTWKKPTVYWPTKSHFTKGTEDCTLPPFRGAEKDDDQLPPHAHEINPPPQEEITSEPKKHSKKRGAEGGDLPLGKKRRGGKN